MIRKLFAQVCIAIGLLAIASPASAQRVNIKTNALYWAAASPNLGAEFRINRHITFNLDAVYHRFKGGKFNTKGFAFEPEVRYWFSGRPQAGHFLGIAAVGANYDFRIKNKRHDGDVFGGGVTYGYSFVLSRHWSIETTLGVGAVYRQEKYAKSQEEFDALEKANINKVNFAPVKAGVTFVYIIK